MTNAVDTVNPVELRYVSRSAHRVTEIEIGPAGHVFDYCDCHKLVWNAETLRYNAGPDIYVCPLYV